MDFETLLPYLAGVIAVPIVQFAKANLNLSGKPVVVLSIVVSAALGVGAVAFASDGFDLLRDGTAAFAAATAIYKLIPAVRIF